MSNTAALPGNCSREEYEDFVFREVMALYAESESRRIAKEAEILNASSKPVRKKRIISLIKKVNNKNQVHTVKPFIKKLVSMAAAVVLTVTIALNTSVSTIAVMRARGGVTINDKFTEMDVKVYGDTFYYDVLNKKDVYYDEDFLGWEARYKLTYIPKNLKLHHSDTEDPQLDEFYQYRDPNEDYVWLSFRQSHFFMGGGSVYIGKATIYEIRKINGYSALFVSHNNPGNQAVKTSTTVLWAEGDTLLYVSAFNIDPYEVLKVAENIIRIK